MRKIIRFFKHVRKLRKKSGFPKGANYEVTTRCNLNCEHCYLKKGVGCEKELSDAEWKQVFLEHKQKGITAAHFTGGEPTLRMDVLKSANHIFNTVSIVTNGTIKIPKEINRLIFVSIDGPEKVHNKIRGVDVFRKVIKNIQDDKRVVLTPTLSTSNFKYVEDLVRIARKANIAGIMFSTYTTHSKSEDKLLLKGEELCWTIDKLKELRKKNKDIFFQTPFMIEMFREKPHHKDCYFKRGEFVSFDPFLKEKKPCVLGEKVNCETCGCIVPMFGYALRKPDIKAWFMFDKLYPEEFCKVQ